MTRPITRLRAWLGVPDTSGHDTRDYDCTYWWGDRHGSLTARCPICNPKEKP